MLQSWLTPALRTLILDTASTTQHLCRTLLHNLGSYKYETNQEHIGSSSSKALGLPPVVLVIPRPFGTLFQYFLTFLAPCRLNQPPTAWPGLHEADAGSLSIASSLTLMQWADLTRCTATTDPRTACPRLLRGPSHHLHLQGKDSWYSAPWKCSRWWDGKCTLQLGGKCGTLNLSPPLLKKSTKGLQKIKSSFATIPARQAAPCGEFLISSPYIIAPFRLS